jgi:predicted small lipoprotein YifL
MSGRYFIRRFLARSLAAAALVSLAGCGADPLKTYPVSGKLVAPDGATIPGAGYMVIFRTEVDLGEGKTKFVTADAGI